ncbi:unnamed protein product [Paramecium sonneborni]|uniref:Uncharacterized protein n=1 Tax=Paramecium sonneborni TaxID=65129 RepID=A0A8S1KPM3_9CILI|nr:unnamed protein product [Paramecium sonneborni]
MVQQQHMILQIFHLYILQMLIQIVLVRQEILKMKICQLQLAKIDILGPGDYLLF